MKCWQSSGTGWHEQCLSGWIFAQHASSPGVRPEGRDAKQGQVSGTGTEQAMNHYQWLPLPHIHIQHSAAPVSNTVKWKNEVNQIRITTELEAEGLQCNSNVPLVHNPKKFFNLLPMIQFNIILPSLPQSSRASNPKSFTHQNSVYFVYVQHFTSLPEA